MYFRFLDWEDKNLEIVEVARSSNSYEGYILVIVRKH